MTDHNNKYWDINRNRDHKDWIPTTKEELESEMKRLQERLQLCKNVYENISKKES